MRLNVMIAVVAVGLISVGCAGTGTFLPVAQDSQASPIPAQELLLAKAADEATQSISFGNEVRGKTVYVQVVGVLPHSQAGLTQYLAANVEEALATAGAKIEQTTWNTDKNGMAYSANPNADFRIVLYVRAGGVDFKTQNQVPIVVINYKEIAISRVNIKVVAFDLRGGGTGGIEPQTGEGSAQEVLVNQFNLFGQLKLPFGTEHIGKAQEKSSGGPLSSFLSGFGL